MDKEQNIVFTGDRVDLLLLIGQQVRDFAANQFEYNKLKINEALAALGGVAATFLVEFSEQCDTTTLDELQSLFVKFVDSCLESRNENEK